MSIKRRAARGMAATRKPRRSQEERRAASAARFREKLLQVLARLSLRIEQLWLTIFADAPAATRGASSCNIVVLTLSV